MPNWVPVRAIGQKGLLGLNSRFRFDSNQYYGESYVLHPNDICFLRRNNIILHESTLALEKLRESRPPKTVAALASSVADIRAACYADIRTAQCFVRALGPS